MAKNTYTKKGQAALIIVLVSAIILTIGIAAATHVTSDVKITSQSEESAMAFAAAEAGLELGLLHGTSGTWQITPTPPNVAGASYSVVQIPDLPAETEYSLGAITKGNARTIWLVDDPNNPTTSPKYSGHITVKWDPSTADVEFIAYFDDGGNIQVRRWLISSGNTIDIDSSDPPLNNNWMMLRVHPLTEDLTNAVVLNYNTSTFPSQGIFVESIGQTNSGITRRVVSTKWHDSFPSIFDYVLYSGSGLTK